MKYAISLALFGCLLGGSSAYADLVWQPTKATSCAKVCSSANMSAVTSGKYEGQDFYICSMKLPQDTSDRPGYNLIQGLSPNGEKCFSASGSSSVFKEEYNCLCDRDVALYPKGPFDVSATGELQSLQKVQGLKDGGFVISYGDKFQRFDKSAKKVGALTTHAGQFALLDDGGYLSFWHEQTGTVDRAGIYTAYVQRYGKAGKAVGSKLEVLAGNENDNARALAQAIMPLSHDKNDRFVLMMTSGFRIFDITNNALTELSAVQPKARYGYPDTLAEAITLLSNDSFEILSLHANSNGEDYYATRYDNSGKVIAKAVKWSADDVDKHNMPALVAGPLQRFTAFYPDYVVGSPPQNALFARSFDANGAPVAKLVTLEQTKSDKSMNFQIAPVGHDCSAVVWEKRIGVPNSDPKYLGKTIYPADSIQMLLVKGTAEQGKAETLVTKEYGRPSNPMLAELKNGDVLVAWVSDENSKFTVKAQIFPKEDFSCKN